MFADDYPRFIELSELPSPASSRGRRKDLRTAAEQRHRMNERYEAMFAANRDIFDGARVLDLASHDGRYSFAALRTGAAHVTGVEVRQSLVDRAHAAFEHYEQDPATYRFIQGDVFDVLAREELAVDVVLCFGFLYHTYRHTELMYRLHALAPRHLVVDTMVTLDRRPTLKLIREESVEDLRSAAADPWSVGRVMVLRPSVPALLKLLSAYEFEVESIYDWAGHLAGRPALDGLAGYASGKRVTVRCRSRQAARAAGLPPVTTPLRIPTQRRAGGTRTARAPRWREVVNGTLARATGYELRRAVPGRRRPARS